MAHAEMYNCAGSKELINLIVDRYISRANASIPAKKLMMIKRFFHHSSGGIRPDFGAGLPVAATA
jgi:hypothetical protein